MVMWLGATLYCTDMGMGMWVRQGTGWVWFCAGYGDVVRGRLFPDCRREDGDAVGHLHTCHNSCIHSKPTQASSHLLTDNQKERQTNKQEDIKK